MLPAPALPNNPPTELDDRKQPLELVTLGFRKRKIAEVQWSSLIEPYGAIRSRIHEAPPGTLNEFFYNALLKTGKWTVFFAYLHSRRRRYSASAPVMDAKSLAVSIARSRIVAYVNAGSIAILIFDSFLTFEQEVRAIWSTSRNYTKIMYVLTRYSAVVEAGIIIYQITIPGDWYDHCSLAFKINAWLFVFGLGVGEVIMTTRTWAVWNKNRFLTYALPIFYFVIWAGGFVINAIFGQSLKFEPNPLTPYVGCYATWTDPIIFISWILLLFYDAVMFVLMVIPALRAYRSRGRSRLLIVVYRDGVIYYLYLFVMSLVNIFVTLTFPPELILIVSFMSRMIHAILACRVVLHIDKYGRPLPDYSY